MKALLRSISLRTLAALLFCPAITLPIFASGTGENVAVLYAIDGQALYRVDPNTGVFTKIADFTQAPLLGPRQLTYHLMNRKLYTTVAQLDNNNQPHLNILEIDPGSAETRLLGQMLNVPMNMAYHLPTQQLYAISVADHAMPPTVIETVDTETGMLTPTPYSGIPGGLQFFSPGGGLWRYWVQPDATGNAVLSESPFLGAGEHRELDGKLPVSGNSPPLWPFYGSFSFDPYTGMLFATFQTYVADGFYTSLCIVDLKTGQPAKVIANYDKPNWSFVIAWGVSQ